MLCLGYLIATWYATPTGMTTAPWVKRLFPDMLTLPSFRVEGARIIEGDHGHEMHLQTIRPVPPGVIAEIGHGRDIKTFGLWIPWHETHLQQLNLVPHKDEALTNAEQTAFRAEFLAALDDPSSPVYWPGANPALLTKTWAGHKRIRPLLLAGDIVAALAPLVLLYALGTIIQTLVRIDRARRNRCWRCNEDLGSLTGTTCPGCDSPVLL